MKMSLFARALYLIPVLLSTFGPPFCACFAQGSLTPPGAPGPTMKTLDQVRPGVPMPATVGFLNITNPGCYYLVTNLITSGGITIATNDVTFDLNGFTVVCNFPNPAFLVSFSGGPYTNIVIRNGKIANSGSGAVSAQNTEYLMCENLLITDCSANNSALTTGPRSRVRHCALYNVKSGIDSGVESVVEDCVVVNSAQSGIFVGTNSVVRRCLVSRCGYAGIQAVSSGLIADNVVSACGFTNGGGAIQLTYSGTRVEGNQLTGNYSWLQAFGPTNFIFRNTSIGSGAPTFIGAQVIGPIINTSGTVTNNNPWANFVF